MECGTQEGDYYSKLELIKEIRQKTIITEKMKLSMKELVKELQSEEGTLKEYQSELELLIQEKMAHVEELRLIHTDIHTMEDLAKQAKSTRQRIIDEIGKMHEEFLPVQKEVNEMRAAIGVPPLEESLELPSGLITKTTQSLELKQPVPPQVSSAQPVPLNTLSEGLGTSATGMPKSMIRQQQSAPMKSCQSCHQLIHRNAPICPLCKAKSRSRNPKKARRRQDV